MTIAACAVQISLMTDKQWIGVSARGAAVAEDIRGVAVGIGEDGRVVVASSGVAGMSRHERAAVACALADLLAEMMCAGEAGGLRVH